MLGGLADRITCLGISMMVAKDSMSAKVSELGCKRLESEMKLREKWKDKGKEKKKDGDKKEISTPAPMESTAKKADVKEEKKGNDPAQTVEVKEVDISKMESDFKSALEEKFGIKIIDFEESDGDGYDENWTRQFDFLSSFTERVKESYDSKTGDLEKDIPVEDVRTWLKYMCDESVAHNLESFKQRHKSDMFIRIIDDVNEILYSFYPGYEDMYLDQEQELQNETDKAVEEKLRNGGEMKMPRVLMIRLPRSKMKLNPEADGRGGVYPEPEPISFGERVKKAAEAANTDKK